MKKQRKTQHTHTKKPKQVGTNKRKLAAEVTCVGPVSFNILGSDHVKIGMCVVGRSSCGELKHEIAERKHIWILCGKRVGSRRLNLAMMLGHTAQQSILW